MTRKEASSVHTTWSATKPMGMAHAGARAYTWHATTLAGFGCQSKVRISANDGTVRPRGRGRPG